MQTTDLQAVVREYLKMFSVRDLQACLAFYSPDATVRFQSALFRGNQAIEKWHVDRFAADLQVLRVDRVSVEEDTVLVEGVVTSNRLKAWKLDTITGTMTIAFDGDKIKEVTFG